MYRPSTPLVTLQFSSDITLQLCSALPHSTEGAGQGSCPKTISPGGNTFAFKKLATDLASLPTCGTASGKAPCVHQARAELTASTLDTICFI